MIYGWPSPAIGRKITKPCAPDQLAYFIPQFSHEAYLFHKGVSSKYHRNKNHSNQNDSNKTSHKIQIIGLKIVAREGLPPHCIYSIM